VLHVTHAANPHHPRLGDIAELCHLRMTPPFLDHPHGFWYVDISSIDRHTRCHSGALDGGRSRAESGEKLLRAGDVVLSTVRAERNAVAIVPDHLDGAVASTGLAVIRPKKPLTSEYLFWLLKHPVFRESVAKLGRASMYPAIHEDDVVTASVPALHNLREQQRITTEIRQALRDLYHATARLHHLWPPEQNTRAFPFPGEAGRGFSGR
jgi:type I restriction enzyme S subunit